MNHFEHIQITNFRRLIDIEVDLNPVTLLVGEDSVGKSTFLDAWLLMQAASRGSLTQQIENWNGIVSLLTRSEHHTHQPDVEQLSVGLGVSHPTAEPLAYQLSLKHEDRSYWISQEKLTQKDGRMFIDFLEPLHVMQSPGIQASNPEAKLAFLQATEESPLQLRHRLSTLRHYQPIDVSITSHFQQPQTISKMISPKPNGDHFIACLDSFRNHHPACFERIEEIIRETIPHFERFDFPMISNGKISLAWKDWNYAQSFSIDQIPLGTLRFIWLLTILLQPEPPELILIDEPQLGLHSKMLRPVAELIYEKSHQTQFIVTSQSDRLARCFQPEDVIVAEREAGGTCFTRGDEIELNRWLVAYSLGCTSELSPEPHFAK